MDWLSSNWIWLALGVGALALFGFGRGGCGMGHGGHDHRRESEEDQPGRPRQTTAGLFSTPAARVDSADTPLQPADHTHGAPSAKEGALATEHAEHGNAPGQAEPRRHRHGC
jgi:hypothetical protein